MNHLNATLTNGVYGLLGPNGAGKTTFMRLLCTVQRPTSGKIVLGGKSIWKLGERYRGALGYLPQHFGYYPDFTALDFLLYVAALKGLDDRKAKKVSNELLEEVGLSGESRRKIKTFSGGMKQRLGIAQAMLNDPYILILDEPTAGLDPKERVSARFSDIYGNWNGLRVSDVFGDETITIGYVDGWLSTSQNLTKTLTIFSLFIIVMIAPVFCGEYSGVDNIILSSKYGRTKCAAAKVIASVLAALMTSIVVLAVNFLMASAFYGSDGLDCSILFAQLTYIEGSIPFNITCGTLLAYQAMLAVTGALGVTGITLIFSAACKNQMIALVASAAVYALPLLFPVAETSALFRLVALLPPYHTQFVSLMSIGQMSGILLYAIAAVPAAVILVAIGSTVSRRIFAKHQVS